MKKKKRIILEIASKYRDEEIKTDCPYFGSCGGCLFQDITYENQLKIKQEYLSQLYEGIIEVPAVLPSPSPMGYRTRMDFVAAFGKNGLRQRGSYKNVVDIQQCPLMPQKANDIWAKMLPILKETEDYNYLRHEGYLRYVVLRQVKFTNQIMCNFVISEKENRLNKLIETIEPYVDSISLIHNDGIADSNFGDLWLDVKQGFITEKFDNIQYKITPNSFFQSNCEVALQMYREIAKNVEDENVLDLYSGLGTITLYIANKAKNITGVEINAEAVEQAKENAIVNNIKNANFVCADALEFMKENKGKFNTLVVDPPRAGMHPKVVKNIKEMAPQKIVYMSCGPESLKNDLELLQDEYLIKSYQPFDMFPQTPHVESLTVLERK